MHGGVCTGEGYTSQPAQVHDKAAFIGRATMPAVAAAHSAESSHFIRLDGTSDDIGYGKVANGVGGCDIAISSEADCASDSPDSFDGGMEPISPTADPNERALLEKLQQANRSVYTTHTIQTAIHSLVRRYLVYCNVCLIKPCAAVN